MQSRVSAALHTDYSYLQTAYRTLHTLSYNPRPARKLSLNLTLSALVFCQNGLVQLVQRRQLPLVHQVELPFSLSAYRTRPNVFTHLVHEQEEVPIACVQMRCTGRYRQHPPVPPKHTHTHPRCRAHRCGQSGCCTGVRTPGTVVGTASQSSHGNSSRTACLHRAQRSLAFRSKDVTHSSPAAAGGHTDTGEHCARAAGGQGWSLNTRTHLAREDLLVVKQSLRPVHQCVDVLRRGQLRRLLVSYPVFPQVFVSVVPVSCCIPVRDVA